MTEQKRAKPAAGFGQIEKYLEIVKIVLDSLDDAILVLDLEMNIIKSNRALRRLFSVNEIELLTKDIFGLLTNQSHLFDRPKAVLEYFKKAMRLPQKSFYMRTRLNENGKTPYSLISRPLTDSSGTVVGCLFSFRDLTRYQEDRLTLIQKNEELEWLVHMISHDLKNPIAVIQGVTELMAVHFKDFLDQDGHEFIQMMRQESRKMIDMIEDLLQLSRIHQGKIDREEVDTLDLVNSIVTEFQHIYRDIQVVFIIQESLPVVQAQEMMFSQLFKNLITNAVKYCDRSKKRNIIEIGYYSKDEHHCFFVKDNGIGMDAEEKEHIFDLFFRSDDKQKQIEGTGLGTHIIKKIVEAHKGRIQVETAKDVGTTFTFTIPVKAD